jgi:PPP family 3-phenylpropionic acid transporter
MPLAVRIGLFHAAIYIGTGVSSPYMPVWFRAQHLSGTAIGVLISAPMLVRIFSGPVLAVWADGFALRRTPLLMLGLGAGLTYAVIGLVVGFVPWLIAWVMASSLLATMAPLADVMTLRAARSGGFHYGWPRGIGSIAFVFGNVAMGALLSGHMPVIGVVAWTAAAGLLAGLAAPVLLPPMPVHEDGEVRHHHDRWRGVGDLVRNKPFMLAVTSAAAIQASHAFYYTFSAILWPRQGIPPVFVGILWGAGVTVEIAFMWWMEPWRRRVGPERLLMIGGAAAILRWTAFAFSPPLWVLFPLQALHALSFTAVFMGSLQLIERLAPREAASAAQTVASALSGGLVIGLATILSGPLFDAFGPFGYLAMSALAAAGVGGAVLVARRTKAPG